MSFFEALSQSPGQILEIFSEVWRQGWFFFVPVTLLYMIYWYWLEYQTGSFIQKINFINLSIQVPSENEQSPKVMEEFFNAIHAIQTNPNFLDRFWKGKIQEWFSVEIIGIDGDVKFIVRTPDYFKDLVEAHLFAQFPDVEITEVEDDVSNFPNDFKKAGWDLFGTDIILTNKDFYPIRTYPFFEHQMTKRIIDPIATAAEVMNTLKQGEQIWIQFTIRPVMTAWSQKGRDFAKEMMGQSISKKTPAALAALSTATQSVANLVGEAQSSDTGDEMPAALLMPPGERKVVESIERNVSKLAFEFKGRLAYAAKKDLFNKRRFNAIMGVYKQFNSFDMNGFKPNKSTITKVDYFFPDMRVRWRQTKLLRGFKSRSFVIGPPPANLTSESLASVFHIPDITVKAPRIPHTGPKTSSAPTNLPTMDLEEAHFEL